MGFFDKVRELFTDEYEEEQPIKKEVIKVEIASPKMEEPKFNDNISDSSAISNIEKISSPVFFSDKDFEDLNKVSKVEKEYNKTRGSFTSLKKEKEKEEPKIFKPSLIISPVYGIIDENYNKDEVKARRLPQRSNENKIRELDIDAVRNKAFGTLEEELETELLSTNSILFSEELNDEPEVDLFEELKNKEKIIVHNNDEDIFEEKDVVESVEENIVQMFEDDDQLTEGDLFDLIDSMYEKGVEIDE